MLDEIANDLVWNYLCRMDNYFVAHRLVKTRIFGDHTVHAYDAGARAARTVSLFSIVDPILLHMSIAWQESKALRDTSSKHMAIYPPASTSSLALRRTTEQKMFWGARYKVRTKTAIEHLLNLTNAGHAHENPAVRGREAERLPGQEPGERELACTEPADSHEVFFATLVSKAQSSIIRAIAARKACKHWLGAMDRRLLKAVNCCLI